MKNNFNKALILIIYCLFLANQSIAQVSIGPVLSTKDSNLNTIIKSLSQNGLSGLGAEIGVLAETQPGLGASLLHVNEKHLFLQGTVLWEGWGLGKEITLRDSLGVGQTIKTTTNLFSIELEAGYNFPASSEKVSAFTAGISYIRGVDASLEDVRSANATPQYTSSNFDFLGFTLAAHIGQFIDHFGFTITPSITYRMRLQNRGNHSLRPNLFARLFYRF